MKATYARVAGVEQRLVNGSLFLAHPGTGDLYRANVTVAALWNALADPATGTELVALFRAAYPRVPAAKMRAQVGAMLADLVQADLVERRAAPPPRRRR